MEFLSLFETFEQTVDVFDLLLSDNLGPYAIGAKPVEFLLGEFVRRRRLPIRDVIYGVLANVEDARQDLRRHLFEAESVDRDLVVRGQPALIDRAVDPGQSVFVELSGHRFLGSRMSP
jgi:hypothetical protein